MEVLKAIPHNFSIQCAFSFPRFQWHQQNFTVMYHCIVNFLYFSCFHLSFEFPCLQSVYLWKHRVGWTTEDLGLALNLRMIPYVCISKSSVFKKKKKKKIFYLLKISFSLVWSVWLPCGKTVDFPVLFIKTCKSPLFNTFYPAWTVVFLEEYTEIRQKPKVVLTEKY